jgi:hypothetical protein
LDEKIAAEKSEENALIQTLAELKTYAKQMRGKPNAAKAAADAAAAEDDLVEWRAAHFVEKKEKKVSTVKKTARDLLEEAAAAAMELEKKARARAERDRRVEALATEMRNMLLMIYAKNKFTTLNIVPSKLGLFHFHAVIHALMERATVGVWPLGAKIPSVSIYSPEDAYVATEMLSVRHMQLIISCQRSFRMRYKKRVARGEIIIKERPQVHERALDDAEQTITNLDKAIAVRTSMSENVNDEKDDGVSDSGTSSGSADGEPEHVSESSKSASTKSKEESDEEEEEEEESDEEEEESDEEEDESDEVESNEEKRDSNEIGNTSTLSGSVLKKINDENKEDSEAEEDSEEDSEDDGKQTV